jgi:hypothetical protein
MTIPRLLRAALLGAATTFVLASPALAAGPWSSPQNVGAPSDYVQEPSLAFGGAGSAGVLGWLTRQQPAGTSLPGAFGRDTSNNDGYAGHLGLLSDPPRETDTLSDSLAAPPALYGRDRAVLLRTRVLSSDADFNRRLRLGVSFAHPSTGAAGALHELARGILTSTAVAANARGDAIAAWVELLPRRNDRDFERRTRLRISLRRAGGRFGRPVTLRSGVGSGQVAVAYNQRGGIVLAYTAGRSLYARVRRGGHGWSRPRRLGPNAGFVDASVVMAPSGRAVVAWGTQDGGEEANQPWVVRAAVLPARSTTFRAAQTLEPGGAVSRPAGRVAIALGADGRAAIAWSGAVHDPSPSPGINGTYTFPVRVALSDTAGRFGAAQQVAPSGAAGDVAMRGDGTALVVWAGLQEHTYDYQDSAGVFAALRGPADAAFSAPETIAPPDEPALDPRGAFDPSGGASVIWAGRPGGHSTATGVQRTAVLRESRRG